MSDWGMAAYQNGIESLFSAQVYNLFWVVDITNCVPGTHQFTLPINAGGDLTWVWGEDAPVNQTVNLGGSGQRVDVSELTISGRTVTIKLAAADFGAVAISYSFYLSR